MSGKPQLWNQQDLERRLCHALDIATKTVESLGEGGYSDPQDAQNQIRPEKVISETALLLLSASAVSSLPPVGKRFERAIRALRPHARSERILLGLCLEPALALDFATAHVCLSQMGYGDARFDRLLRQALLCQSRYGRERVPHRVLEQEWLRGMWTGRPEGKRRWAAARESVLGRPMDLLTGSRDDGYAFTHALMYVTRLGRSSAKLPRSRKTILLEADALLARCLDEQDYDLAGEVLLAWPHTRAAWSATAAFAFHVLAHVEDRVGFLPNPSTRLDRLKELTGRARTDYLLATSYHTIYVMGLLAAAILGAGAMPPVRLPTNGGARGSADRLLRFLSDVEPRPHWRERFDSLSSEEERDSLAGLLLAVALRRKGRQRDFDGMYRLLREGFDLGLADSPMASHAAEMLARIAAVGAETRVARCA